MLTNGRKTKNSPAANWRLAQWQMT